MVKGAPSINPAGSKGRPAVANMLDSLGLGKNTQGAFEFVRDLMLAKLPDPKNPTMLLDVPLALRLDAAKWLAEKRTGKAPATVEVEHGGTVQHAHHIRLNAYSEAQLAQMERLLEVGAVDQLVEGELVEPDAQVTHETINIDQ